MHAAPDVPAAMIQQVEADQPQRQSGEDSGGESLLVVDRETRRARAGSIDLDLGRGFDRVRQPQGAIQ